MLNAAFSAELWLIDRQIGKMRDFKILTLPLGINFNLLNPKEVFHNTAYSVQQPYIAGHSL